MLGKPAWASRARCGQMYRHKQQVFFACEGMIVLRDEREDHCDDDYVVVSPDDFRLRADAVNEYGIGFRASNVAWQQTEYRVCCQAAQDIVEAVKEAKDMGDPMDPAVQAYWAKHRGRRSTVTVGGRVDPRSPELPPIPLGRFTGKTCEAGVSPEAARAALDTVPGIHRPPRRLNRTSKLILEL